MRIDRRPEYRRDAFKFGTVRCEGAADLSCLVWDMTGMGAKIEVETPEAAPDRFGLVVGQDGQSIDGQPIDGQPIPCRVIWRSGLKIGVAFLWEPAARED